MARTKQTARKNTGGKSLATYLKPKPQPRKVILEYSSDENVDQQVPGVELGKPKRVKKRITLTLPAKPTQCDFNSKFPSVLHPTWNELSFKEGVGVKEVDHRGYAAVPDQLHGEAWNKDTTT